MIVINQTPIEELNQLYLYIPGGLLILLILVLGVIDIWKSFKGEPITQVIRFTDIYLVIAGIGLVILIAWSVVASIFLKTPSGRYTYEATFTDIESVNEAFEKYEFIEYNNGIYTFKDKEK